MKKSVETWYDHILSFFLSRLYSVPAIKVALNRFSAAVQTAHSKKCSDIFLCHIDAFQITRFFVIITELLCVETELVF